MTQIASLLIPKNFCHVEVLQAREVFAKDADGEWQLSAEHSTSTLQEQLDDWLLQNRHVVQSASPPSTSVFYLDEEQTLRCYLTGMTVCYVAATEGAEYQREPANAAASKPPASELIATTVPASTGPEVGGAATVPTIGGPRVIHPTWPRPRS